MRAAKARISLAPRTGTSITKHRRMMPMLLPLSPPVTPFLQTDGNGDIHDPRADPTNSGAPAFAEGPVTDLPIHEVTDDPKAASAAPNPQ